MAVKGESAIPVDDDLLKSSSPIRGPGDFRRGGERKTTVRRTLLGLLAAGALAGLILFDPGAPVVVDADALKSKSKNSPFDGRRLQGKIRSTWVSGRQIFGG